MSRGVIFECCCGTTDIAVLSNWGGSRVVDRGGVKEKVWVYVCACERNEDGVGMSYKETKKEGGGKGFCAQF